MKAIVGLGNPGPRYRATRHNVGWQVVDELTARWRATPPVKARHAEVSRAEVEGETMLLLKPQTFMNDSGKAVRALMEKDGLAPEEILVVYDDLDLALGRIRVRAQGSAGGHRGIRSIQDYLADGLPDFPRIRVGIGRPPAGVDPIDFVLARFVPDELLLIQPAIQRAADAAECWVRSGTAAAANQFNGG